LPAEPSPTAGAVGVCAKIRFANRTIEISNRFFIFTLSLIYISYLFIIEFAYEEKEILY
jgi:hypothetical protein